jgi:predicted N-acyltransferase
MYSARVFHSIDHLMKDQWDRLVQDNVYMSYGWLKTVEETFIGDVGHRYIVLPDHQGILGAAVCQVFNKSDKVFDLDDCMFGRYKKAITALGFSFLPAFVCCPIKGYGRHFLFHEGLDPARKEIVAKGLIRAIETEAFKHGLSVSFTNVTTDESELIRLLRRRDYRRTLDHPITYLDIGWPSFSGYTQYVKRLRGSSRVIRHEINKNRRAGVTIRELRTVEGCEERLHDLLEKNYQKYNGKSFPYRRAFFSRVKQNLREDAVIYVAEQYGEIVGVSLLLHRADVGHMSVIGVDHEQTSNDFTYFNIGFYRPIRDAISAGRKKMYFGTRSYKLKARRGLKVLDAHVYHRPSRRMLNAPLKPLFAVHSRIKPWFLFRE